MKNLTESSDISRENIDIIENTNKQTIQYGKKYESVDNEFSFKNVYNSFRKYITGSDSYTDSEDEISDKYDTNFLGIYIKKFRKKPNEEETFESDESEKCYIISMYDGNTYYSLNYNKTIDFCNEWFKKVYLVNYLNSDINFYIEYKEIYNEKILKIYGKFVNTIISYDKLIDYIKITTINNII